MLAATSRRVAGGWGSWLLLVASLGIGIDNHHHHHHHHHHQQPSWASRPLERRKLATSEGGPTLFAIPRPTFAAPKASSTGLRVTSDGGNLLDTFKDCFLQRLKANILQLRMAHVAVMSRWSCLSWSPRLSSKKELEKFLQVLYPKKSMSSQFNFSDSISFFHHPQFWLPHSRGGGAKVMPPA